MISFVAVINAYYIGVKLKIRLWLFSWFLDDLMMKNKKRAQPVRDGQKLSNTTKEGYYIDL